MEMFWVMALKPFVAAVFLGIAYVIARGLAKLIPSGRVKDVLFDRTIAERHPWKIGFLVIFGGFGGIFLVAWLGLWIGGLLRA